jgi:hypothetical protein
LLGRFGIKFTKLGPIVEYHGKRQPCIGVVAQILNGVKQQRPDVYEFVTSVNPDAVCVEAMEYSQPTASDSAGIMDAAV